LEDSLLKGVAVDGEMASCEHTLAATLQTIADLTAAETIADSGCDSPNWEAASELVVKLHTLLEGSDFVPLELLELLKKALPGPSTRKLLQQIEKQVGNIDYRSARISLAELEAGIAQHLQRGSS
jgi:hypothetical protein